MKNLYYFEKVVYKGNLKRNFYFYALSKNKSLFKYIFFHLYYSILGFFSEKMKLKGKENYFIFLKDIKDIDALIDGFYEKYKTKIRKTYISQKDNIIVATSPSKIVEKFFKTEKIYAPHWDKNYTLKYTEHHDKVLKINKEFDNVYYQSWSQVGKFACTNNYICKCNIQFICHNLKQFKTIRTIWNFVLPLILSGILLLVSFLFTTIGSHKLMMLSYMKDPLLLLLNFIPIFLILLFVLFLTKRLWISFGFTSLLVLIMGIVNQTKLFYRDDVLKFEDLALSKEALVMTSRYKVIIGKYGIIAIILCLLILALLMKKKKMKFRFLWRLPVLIGIVSISILLYYKVYINQEIYNSVGDTSIINIWIGTRNSQIRGLIYPFINSSTELNFTKPNGYNEDKAKEVLNRYTYRDIVENEKVNVIAIMLESYNDFSKFDTVEFTTDMYKELHEIQKDSLHGNLIVNVFGGGTINTERQFITGFSSFPSFRKTTNSYAWYFKEQGYTVEANHPMYGAFYNRNTANANLGFDNFYNHENKYTVFALDQELFADLVQQLKDTNSKGEKYFNFSVTYQNHGMYSADPVEKTYIKNTGYSEESYNIFNRYLDGIQSTNKALYTLYEEIKNYQEPTVLIVFGDHNPYLGTAFEEANISLQLDTIEGFQNYYSTPYFIYGNPSAREVFNKEFKGTANDISPLFLMNEFFNYVGYEGNPYMQYTSDIKKNIDVIHSLYLKENGQYIRKEDYDGNILDEFNKVNYYYAVNKYTK